MAKTFTYNSEVYFDELDALGVLHHTRYLIHLERAQQAFFQKMLGVSDFNAERDKDIYVVVHSLETRYRVPLTNPGPIAVAYTTHRIRSGGLTQRFEVKSSDGQLVYCDGLRTVCKLSHITHKPCAWTEAFRKRLEMDFAAT